MFVTRLLGRIGVPARYVQMQSAVSRLVTGVAQHDLQGVNVGEHVCNPRRPYDLLDTRTHKKPLGSERL